VLALGAGDLTDLLANCVSLGISAVRNPLDRKPAAWDHADRLAQAAGLDMTCTWAVNAERYLGRVIKPRILEAVVKAVGTEAAEPIGGLKTGEMAEAAEQLLAGTGWLPPLLRTAAPVSEPVIETDHPMAAE
jgi:ParB family chromosome partitioning protein